MLRLRHKARTREAVVQMTWILLGAGGLGSVPEFDAPYYIVIDKKPNVDPFLMSKSGMQ